MEKLASGALRAYWACSELGRLAWRNAPATSICTAGPDVSVKWGGVGPPIGVWRRFREGQRRRPQSSSPSRFPSGSKTVGDTKCQAGGAASAGEPGVVRTPRPLYPERHPRRREVGGAQSSRESPAFVRGGDWPLGKELRARRLESSLGGDVY